MKKLLSVVFACAIAVSALAGCGKKDIKLSILDTKYTVEDYSSRPMNTMKAQKLSA